MYARKAFETPMIRTIPHITMPTVCWVIGIVILCIFNITTVNACIYGSDEDLAEIVKQDKLKQLHMVADLARQADTVVIAKAISESIFTKRTTFEIRKVFKVVRRAVWRSLPVVGDQISFPLTYDNIGYACSPSQMFLNRMSIVGGEYILYAKDGVLLRAGDTTRYGPDVPFSDEMQAIERVIAESKSSSRRKSAAN